MPRSAPYSLPTASLFSDLVLTTELITADKTGSLPEITDDKLLEIQVKVFCLMFFYVFLSYILVKLCNVKEVTISCTMMNLPLYYLPLWCQV